jgi:DNA repair exonuclease SbcCD ATPase subunit/DNA repair exonuclease SbcCD nuclease subunit
LLNNKIHKKTSVIYSTYCIIKMYDTIIHISDIHIRRGAGRYQEYLNVFENFKQYLKKNHKIQQNSAIIVITGDIFHDKGLTDGYSLSLFYKLLSIAGSSAPTIIISGNHDMKQDDESNPDIIELLTKKIDDENIFYLKDSGIYEFDNIGIGLQNIQDVVDRGNTTGLNKDISPFPLPEFSSSVTYKIALCHVAIDEVCGYYRDKSLISLKHFDGYDYILLGDIHKRQYGTSWGYSGSLIQQNFGEAINHGGLLWDLDNRCVKPFDIMNHVAFLTLNLKNDIYYMSGDKVLSEENLKPMQCTTVHIKTKGIVLNNENRNYIIKVFEESGKQILSWSEVHETEQFKPLLEENCEHFRELNTADMWCSYLKEVVPNTQEELKSLAIDFIQNYSKYIPKQDVVSEYISTKQQPYIFSKLENIRKNDIHKKNDNDYKKLPFELHELKWDWLYSFGSGNSLNFKNYENNIVLLKGKNASGKSNFIEIVLLALFGQTIPSRNNNHFTSYSTIHHNKPKSGVAQTELAFTLGKHTYTLKRKFRVSKSSMLIDATLESPHLEIALKQGAVKNWIKENIGAIQDVLSTTFITQHNDNDFFNLREGERTEYLEKSLNLSSISNMNDIINDTHSVYKQLIMSMEILKDKYQKEIENRNASYRDEQFDDLKNKLKEKELLYASSLHKIENLRTKFDIKDVELFEKYRDDETIELNIDFDIDYINIDKKLYEYEYNLSKYPVSQRDLEQFSDCSCESIEHPKFSFESFRDLEKRVKSSAIPKMMIDDDYDKVRLQIELTKLENSLEELLGNRPRRSRSSLKELEEKENKIKKIETEKIKWIEYIEKENDIVSYISLMNEKKEYNKTLKEVQIQRQDIPHNPDCWACQKHPLYMMEKLLDDKLRMLDEKMMLTLDNPELVSKFEAYLLFKKKFKDIESMKTDLEIEWIHWKQNQEWEGSYREMREQIQDLKDKIYSIEYHEMKKKYEEDRNLLYAWYSWYRNEYELLKKNCDKLRVYNTRKYYETYNEEKENLNQVLGKIEKLKKEFILLEHEKNRMEEIIEKHVGISAELDGYQRIYRMCGLLKDYFEGNRIEKGICGLKEWIQKEKVIPYLMKRINPMISCYDLEIEVSFDFLRYDFYVKDKNTNISILYERASGFQKFVIGLMMRLALSQIGGSKIVPEQMFIDEGFAACDKDNLMKMPETIHQLSQFYKNIVLVSHLEGIQDVATKYISVEKKGGISKFIYI